MRFNVPGLQKVARINNKKFYLFFTTRLRSIAVDARASCVRGHHAAGTSRASETEPTFGPVRSAAHAARSATS